MTTAKQIKRKIETRFPNKKGYIIFDKIIPRTIIRTSAMTADKL
jgi:hypothetical protein